LHVDERVLLREAFHEGNPPVVRCNLSFEISKVVSKISGSDDLGVTTRLVAEDIDELVLLENAVLNYFERHEGCALLLEGLRKAGHASWLYSANV
jgi:hypothetical protein